MSINHIKKFKVCFRALALFSLALALLNISEIDFRSRPLLFAAGKDVSLSARYKPSGDKTAIEVELEIKEPGRNLTALRIDNIGPDIGLWRSDGKEQALPLTVVKDGETISDGQKLFDLPLDDSVCRLILRFPDNGAFARRQTDFRITAFFSDNSRVMTSLPALSEPADMPAESLEQTDDGSVASQETAKNIPDKGKKLNPFVVGLHESAFGYMDNQGKMIISPLFYNRVGSHSISIGMNELACGQINPKHGTWACYNSQGQQIIPPDFGIIGPFSENGLAVAKPLNEAKKYGFIDKTGTWVIEPAFSEASNFGPNGLAPVRAQSNHLWGYIDSSERWVIPAQFREAHPFTANGLARVRAADSNYGFIDEKGAWLGAGAVYSDVGDFGVNGLAPAQGGSQHGLLWGYIDTKGEWIISPRFSSARQFMPNGLAAARNEKADWGFIDKTGDFIIDAKYFFVGDFALNGLVKAMSGNETSLSGYLNAQGEWAIAPKYKIATSFFDNGIAIVSKGDYLGEARYINSDGQEIMIVRYSGEGSVYYLCNADCTVREEVTLPTPLTQ